MVMGEETLHAELLVIGGGTGGYSAAFHAVDLGMKVVLVTDEEHLGGVCLHRGCIPVKALLQPARLMIEAHRAGRWGIAFREPDVDVDQLYEWKNGIVQRLTNGLETLGEQRDIRVIQGRAVFESSTKVNLKNSDMVSHVEFEHAIIATGSRPNRLSGISYELGGRIMDAAVALQQPTIPETLLVVGGGYIGLEMGIIFASLGSKVTLMEVMGEILPDLDRDLVAPVREAANEMFDEILVDTRVTDLQEQDEGVTITIEGEDKSQTFDRALVAIGRRPSTDKLGIENTQIELDDDDFIKVDAERRTSDDHIFAVGDVTGKPLLAHKSMREGKVAAEVIAGQPAAFDVRCIPHVIFTEPEIAYCGLLEDAAREQGYEIEVGKFDWRASGRALTKGAPDGLTKIIFDAQTERILGIGIVGSGASELISEGVLAMEMGAVARDLAVTIHPHPTLSETLAEAAEDFILRPTHA